MGKCGSLWWASCHGRFITGEISSDVHFREECMSPGSGLDDSKGRKSLASACNQTTVLRLFSSQPSHLYRIVNWRVGVILMYQHEICNYYNLLWVKFIQTGLLFDTSLVTGLWMAGRGIGLQFSAGTGNLFFTTTFRTTVRPTQFLMILKSIWKSRIYKLYRLNWFDSEDRPMAALCEQS